MPFLRPIWTFFGTRAPGIEVMVTLRDPDQARCRLAGRSCRTRGRKERALSSPTFAPSPACMRSASARQRRPTRTSLIFATSEPGFPICLPRMAPLYTREPPSARNSVRRTIVQLQRRSPQPALTWSTSFQGVSQTPLHTCALSSPCGLRCTSGRAAHGATDPHVL